MGFKYPNRQVLQIYTTQILITVLVSNEIVVDAANIPQSLQVLIIIRVLHIDFTGAASSLYSLG